MDFGAILDEWDRRTVKTDTAASTQETRLNRGGVYDKDAEERAKRRPAAERRRRLLRKSPDAVIDLHGLTRDEAWLAMDGFFRQARSEGLEKLLIIHGKGNHSEGEAVLRRASREFIEGCPFAGESGHGSSAAGGSGATWVLLKA